MDALDLTLLRHMGIAPFLMWPRAGSARPAALAAASGVSEDTVRRRLAGLRAQGVLLGVLAWVNPRHLGLRAASYHFRLPTQDKSGLAAAAAVPGVFGVYDMVGPEVCVDLAFCDDEEADACIRAVGAALGASGVRAFLDYPLPPVAAPLSPLDWRIARQLAQSASDVASVAATLRVSPRTVRRRLDRMVREGAIDIVAQVDPGAVAGHLVGYLVVRLADGAGPQEARATLAALGTPWVAQWSPPAAPATVVLVTFVPSARALEDLRREALSLATVEAADAMVLQGVHGGDAWLRAQVEARAQTGTVRSAAPRARQAYA